MKNYVKLSCYRGLAVIRVPEDWIDAPVKFASSRGDALIMFTKNNLAFRVFLTSGPRRAQVERVCNPDSVEWGEFCPPWESWNEAEILGASRDTLDLY
jgi:hypothetical protein